MPILRGHVTTLRVWGHGRFAGRDVAGVWGLNGIPLQHRSSEIPTWFGVVGSRGKGGFRSAGATSTRKNLQPSPLNFLNSTPLHPKPKWEGGGGSCWRQTCRIFQVYLDSLTTQTQNLFLLVGLCYETYFKIFRQPTKLSRLWFLMGSCLRLNLE